MEKKCNECDTVKSVHEFYKDLSKRDGYRTICKACTKPKHKARYVRFSDKIKKQVSDYRKDNPEKISASRKKYAHENPLLIKNNHLILRYGITLDDFFEMQDKQNGVCAICFKEETAPNRYEVGVPKALAVDHCKDTGKIRGLLCSACNTGIGKLKHSIELLENAIKYFKK